MKCKCLCKCGKEAGQYTYCVACTFDHGGKRQRPLTPKKPGYGLEKVLCPTCKGDGCRKCRKLGLVDPPQEVEPERETRAEFVEDFQDLLNLTR